MKDLLSVFKPQRRYTLDRLYELIGAEGESSKVELHDVLQKHVQEGALSCRLEILFDDRVIMTLAPVDALSHWSPTNVPAEVYDERRDVNVPLSACNTRCVYSLPEAAASPEPPRVWTTAELRSLWPQARGELRGFQRHLEAKSGITAAQLGMALQLAGAAFDALREPDPKKPRYVSELSTEALGEMFDPTYGMDLNCGLDEHVLRMLAFEHIDRGGAKTEPAIEALTGPARCPHGRDRMGTCAACDDQGDLEEPETVLDAFCEAYREGRPFDRKRLYEALCAHTPRVPSGDDEGGGVSQEEFQETLDQAALPDSDPRKRD